MAAVVLDNGVTDPVCTALCLHGIGMGPWCWEPWFGYFAERRVRAVAITLPGHGADPPDPSFSEVVAAARSARDDLAGEVALVGHSMGGLVCQQLATEREVRALALVAPLLPRQIPVLPSRHALATVPALVPSIVGGRPVSVSWSAYRRVGFHRLDEAEARAMYARVVPWPNRLVRELVLPPAVDASAVRAPVLVALGFHDRLVPWSRARLLADLYEGITWRYDDLGHNPMLEPGGGRMGRDLAAFVAEPVRPSVLEAEAFAPGEGVGHQARRTRRGDARRSAYGQRGTGR
jgi:pimeloyl-ACP methyl ester carboxylesterase